MEKPLKQIKYAILILNRPITQNPQFMRRLWNQASIRITVDGGTNRWDQFISSQPEAYNKGLKLPDLVTGDFDSITTEICDKYKKKGCKIVHTLDQDHTDFTKALLELIIHCNQIGVEIENVVTFAQNSGRLDQVLGNIQTLFLARDKLLIAPKIKIYLISDDSISWLLSPGEHVILISEEVRKSKRVWCSLVPIGEACERVTSTGLKWNLDHQRLKYGDLVSTSNRFDGSDKVTVNCSHTLLWSMRIPNIK
ncbi:thiamin pyrophosphokinase 1 isoform X2 [Trichoplusia ni]|nr:thiamin pyrophosphokinase 1 isoform X2 [Trichoplusia ni]